MGPPFKVPSSLVLQPWLALLAVLRTGVSTHFESGENIEFGEIFLVFTLRLTFRDGEDFLFRAALGLLSLYQEQLLKETDFVLLAQFLTKLPENMDSEALFARIDGIHLGQVHQVA